MSPKHLALTTAINTVNVALVVMACSLVSHPVTSCDSVQVAFESSHTQESSRKLVQTKDRVSDGITHVDGKTLVRRLEGLSLVAYPDPVSHGAPYTCGYGHTGSDCRRGMKITKAQAEKWLDSDYKLAEKSVEQALLVPVSDNRKAALVSFTFNVGRSNLKRSTLVALINSGEEDLASQEFHKWTLACGKSVPGLKFRRTVEYLVYNLG